MTCQKDLITQSLWSKSRFKSKIQPHIPALSTSQCFLVNFKTLSEDCEFLSWTRTRALCGRDGSVVVKNRILQPGTLGLNFKHWLRCLLAEALSKALAFSMAEFPHLWNGKLARRNPSYCSFMCQAHHGNELSNPSEQPHEQGIIGLARRLTRWRAGKSFENTTTSKIPQKLKK